MTPRAFVAEVLLYDHLVIPYPPDSKQRARWEKRGWDPDRLFTRLEKLKGAKVVAPIPWDNVRRTAFRARFDVGSAAHFEAGDPFHATRMLLTKPQMLGLRRRTVLPRVVTAYPSPRALSKDAQVKVLSADEEQDPERRERHLAIMLGREYLVPDDPSDSEDADLGLLDVAISIARRSGFRRKRAALNAHVDQMVAERFTDEEAVTKMDTLISEYNDEIGIAHAHTRVETAFMVAGTSLAIGGHFFPPLWIGSAILTPASFALKRKWGREDASDYTPAAMVRDVQQTFVKRGYRYRSQQRSADGA